MLNSLRHALDWFIDGLIQAVSDIEDQLRRRSPLKLVEAGEGSYALESADGKRERSRIKVDTKTTPPKLQPAEFAAQVEDRDIDVILPPDELLMRTLDPLPPESRQYLDGVVRHQLERLVPWRTDNVLYTYTVAPAGGGDNRLIVTVAATARNLHAPLYAALAAQKPRRVRVVFRATDKTGGEVVIPLDQSRGGGKHVERLRYGVMAGLAALLLIALGGFTWLYIDSEQAASALEANQTELADLRKKLAARGPQGGGDREAQAILTKKRATPAAVVAIDKLSEALPDDTWLTELQLSNEGQLRITGTSQNVADLVPKIEAASIFGDATFFSPTTRLQGSEGDRFHLQMKLRQPPSQGQAPGPRK